MKLSASILLAQAVSAKQTDVQFNHDHEFHQVAELEKWEDLAGKWFRLHGDNLRKSFSKKWKGPNGEFSPEGRFQKEIKKLKKSFDRNCSNKKTFHGRKNEGADGLAQQVKFLNGTSIDDETFKNTTTSNATRERRSSENSEKIHNSGDRIRHVILNIEQWVEETLSNCGNTNKIITRWRNFAKKWERELEKNPIFEQEIEEEKRYFRSQGTADERCGVIFTQFGLHGNQLYLYDAGIKSEHGIDDLGETNFGNDELMSMKPLPGCYIRAYQHVNKEGYSSVCDKYYGCQVKNSSNGPLTENEGSSVYCYCESKTPPKCGTIWSSDTHPYDHHWATVYDGFEIGVNYSMDNSPKYMGNDWLSRITVNKGCQMKIWEHSNKGGSDFTCQGKYHAETCGRYDLGRVGDNEASSISCICPREFDYVRYDIPTRNWKLKYDENKGITIDQVTVENPCYYGGNCPNQSHVSSQTKTVSSSHNWSRVFEQGLSYTAGASATFEGIGMSQSVTMSVKETYTNGETRTSSETLSSTEPCVAGSHTRVICTYVAYPGKIKVGYTIHWKDRSTTRGSYEGEGWHHDILIQTIPY